MKPARSKSRNPQAYLAAQAAQIESDLAGVRRAMRQPLEAEYARGNVTVPQRAAMQVVVQTPGVTLKELSLAISLAHSTVSGIVDRLVKRGMIDRRRDSTDGRLTRLYPSAAVAQFVRDRIPALRTGPLNEALARASADDRLRIVSALKCLRELLESD